MLCLLHRHLAMKNLGIDLHLHSSGPTRTVTIDHPIGSRKTTTTQVCCTSALIAAKTRLLSFVITPCLPAKLTKRRICHFCRLCVIECNSLVFSVANYSDSLGAGGGADDIVSSDEMNVSDFEGGDERVPNPPTPPGGRRPVHAPPSPPDYPRHSAPHPSSHATNHPAVSRSPRSPPRARVCGLWFGLLLLNCRIVCLLFVVI